MLGHYGRERGKKKHISTDVEENGGGHVSAFTPQLIWRATSSSFYPRRSRSSKPGYLECREILQDSCASGNAFGELRNIPGRANRSMR